jgi:hypothetical protein
LLKRPLSLSDEAIDTENNLNSKVLRRNLYRLGLDAGKLSDYEEDLDELAGRRHRIAHGIDLDPIRNDVYEKLRTSAFHFMDGLILAIVGAFENNEYLRN